MACFIQGLPLLAAFLWLRVTKNETNGEVPRISRKVCIIINVRQIEAIMKQVSLCLEQTQRLGTYSTATLSLGARPHFIGPRACVG